MLNKQEIAEAFFKTDLQDQDVFTLVTGLQCEIPTNNAGFRFTFLVLNSVIDYSKRKLRFNIHGRLGLFVWVILSEIFTLGL